VKEGGAALLVAGLSSTWFLSLKLEDPPNEVVSENFYWFSTAP
jgi:hypothetical protein